MDEKIRIHVLHCGSVKVDKAVPFRDVSKNLIAYTGFGRGKKHRIELPVSAYLIEHPKGKVLVDTGWHSDVRTNQINHMTLRLNLASKAILPEGEAVDEQLESLGIKVEDLDYVFISHMDVDHVSGVGLVKSAKRIFASKEELEAVKKGDIRYADRLWKGVNIEPFNMSYSEYGPFNRAYDVFGDGKVLMIDASGHTAGTIVTMIQNNGEFILLTADCGYAKESWEKLRLPGPVDDKEKMITSLKWVQDMAKKENCKSVLATHDPEVEAQVIEI